MDDHPSRCGAEQDRELGMRDQIVQRFETWLDHALEDEGPPEGIAAELLAELTGAGDDGEKPTDSYALWAALTGLTQEIKLQSRAFQMLGERLEPLAEAPARLESVAEGEYKLAQAIAQLEIEVAQRQQRREGELRRECEARCSRQFLEVLIDLHERIRRGNMIFQSTEESVARQRGAGFWARMTGAGGAAPANELLKAHETGSRLLLERLEAVLTGHGVRHVPCVGRPFDPVTMVAMAVEEKDGAADGMVLEELRSGYEWNGDILRVAEVKVARNTS